MRGLGVAAIAWLVGAAGCQLVFAPADPVGTGEQRDGGPGRDGGSLDAADPDAGRHDAGGDECPAACDSCTPTSCTITCAFPGACDDLVTCPPGLDCNVLCLGDGSCNGGIDCSGSDDCNIVCGGQDSCRDAMYCPFGSACAIDCGADSACSGTATTQLEIDCSSSCPCTLSCNDIATACEFVTLLCPGGCPATGTPPSCAGCPSCI